MINNQLQIINTPLQQIQSTQVEQSPYNKLLTIKDYNDVLINNSYFVVYVYSVSISSCQELFTNNILLKYFTKKDISLYVINALIKNKTSELIKSLNISFFPIFIIYKNGEKEKEINGNFENIFEILNDILV